MPTSRREYTIEGLGVEERVWEELGEQETPSWYLHPLVGRQKREVHTNLIRRWARGQTFRRVLKTDLFEEAFGEDQLLPGLFPDAAFVCGMDEAFSTARRAAQRHPVLARGFAAMDVRRPAYRPGSFDLIVSTSTLDHFSARADFVTAIGALAALLAPGGLLILTLDNPWNPLFHPLRWFSRRGQAPFPIGYTPPIGQLRRDLEAEGLAIEAEDWLIHNPRGISTALFLMLARLLGARADRMIGGLLSAFSQLDRLPTRRLTACFQAVAARKPL
ncbi:MAG: class I SAM-dependent methyltransferase [Bryobacterales bacterium]|nr:class I SAM-dependent methyltransferase [Bryobacterales bacterium]